MRASGQAKPWVKQAAHLLLLLFFISLFFSIRFLASIGCVTLFVFSILFSRNYFFRERNFSWFLLAVFIFFLFQFVTLIYTSDAGEGWRNVWTKSGMLITIMGIYGTSRLVRDQSAWVKFYYCLSLVLSCLFFLVVAAIKFSKTNDESNFFYYELVRVTDQHPIFYSVYVFLGLLFLAEAWQKKLFIVPAGYYFAMMFVLALTLILLSSKLVIVFFFLFLVFLSIRLILLKKTLQGLVILLFLLLVPLVVLLTTNPLSYRFREIARGDLKLVQNELNNPGDYFNGLQFRLLQWKIVPRILAEKNAWVLGVSPGDAQHELDKKYISRNMYTGDASRGEEGFLGFYAHNTFLESLLQTGVIGLIIVIAIYLALILWIFVLKDFVMTWIILLLIAVSFTESLFESQYGIAMFTVSTALTWSIQVSGRRKSSQLKKFKRAR